MIAKNRTTLIGKAGAVAALALGIAFVGQSSVSAASGADLAPAVTVTPSTGLPDGATVTVAVSGFGANEEVGTVQCADVEPGKSVCALPEMTQLTTDANGAGSVQKTVHRTFTGYLISDGSLWGPVDCGTYSCAIAAGNAAAQSATATISFQ